MTQHILFEPNYNSGFLSVSFYKSTSLIFERAADFIITILIRFETTEF